MDRTQIVGVGAGFATMLMAAVAASTGRLSWKRTVFLLVMALGVVFLVGECGAQLTTNTPGSIEKLWYTDSEDGTVVLEMRQLLFSTSYSSATTPWLVISINAANGNPYSGGGEGVLASNVTFSTAYATLLAAAANFSSDPTLYRPGAANGDHLAGSTIVLSGGGVYSNSTSVLLSTASAGTLASPYGPGAPTNMTQVGQLIAAGDLVATPGDTANGGGGVGSSESGLTAELNSIWDGVSSGVSASMFSSLDIPVPPTPPGPLQIGGLSSNVFAGDYNDSLAASSPFTGSYYGILSAFLACCLLLVGWRWIK